MPDLHGLAGVAPGVRGGPPLLRTVPVKVVADARARRDDADVPDVPLRDRRPLARPTAAVLLRRPRPSRAPSTPSATRSACGGSRWRRASRRYTAAAVWTPSGRPFESLPLVRDTSHLREIMAENRSAIYGGAARDYKYALRDTRY